MHRNNINLFILFLFVILSSCKKNGNQVESSKARIVNSVKTTNTITYNKIKTGSFLDWRAYHIGGTGKRLGKIYYKEATTLVNKGKVTNLDVLIDMPSLTVENLDEDRAYDLSEHLKHEDFFNTEKHPTSKFELTNLKTIQGEYNSEVTGNLIILDISKSITFKANINVTESEVSIKSEDFIIDRTDWNMTYRGKGTTGVPLNYLISDDIGFTISVTILK